VEEEEREDDDEEFPHGTTITRRERVGKARRAARPLRLASGAPGRIFRGP
jgi:hypothetical protein